jgi:radical SAM protein with 4Fe4S-binding SPASM domain
MFPGTPRPPVEERIKKLQPFTPIDKGQFSLEPPERVAEFERRRAFGHEAEYKEYRRRWTEYPKTKFVSEYPLHIDIELASICNLRCPMCYTITEEFKSKVNTKLMDYALFTKIVDEAAAGGVYSIRLSYRGESFLHKRIVDCVRYAKSKGIREVSTLTNGVRLDEKLFEEIMEAGIDWITISFDGIGETYEKIRAPAKFDRAVEKITNYKKIKEAKGRVKPILKVQSVFPAIRDCIDEFYGIFAPITDMVSSNPLIDYLMKDSTSSICYLENFNCPQVYQRMTVGADGTVMFCANDEENEHPVGNAKTQTVHEIWHGEAFRKIRDAHNRHTAVKDYHACSKCYLPRQTFKEEVWVAGRVVFAENYVGRSQIIGT